MVDALLEGLHNVRHRGATAADRRTGDGAGVLLPLPGRAAPEPGAGSRWSSSATRRRASAIEAACRAEGLEPLEWREVPVDAGALGAEARREMPRIEQLVLAPAADEDEAAASARARAGRAQPAARTSPRSPSGRSPTRRSAPPTSSAHFYPDLRDPALAVPFGIFHQRFSTNTAPSWERAQPFRLLCHNGEINTIEGNVNWMRAREGNSAPDDELYTP